MRYISLSESDTNKFAYLISKKNSYPGSIICLNGDLASGKTLFTKFFARAINIKDHVSSPSFNIIHEYYGEINLYHFDAYRLNSQDLDYLSYQDYFYSKHICIIEWAEIIKNIIPSHALWINIYKNFSRGDNYRLFVTHSCTLD